MHIHFPLGEIHYIMLYVTPLDSSCAIMLGHCWLTQYNPLIDWVKGSIFFWNTPSKPILTTSTTSVAPPRVLTPAAAVPPKTPLHHPTTSEAPKPILVPPAPATKSEKTLRVTILTPIKFTHMSKLENLQVCCLETVIPEVTGRSVSTTMDPGNLDGILEQHHDFADIFSKVKGSVLMDHWPY